MFDAVDHLQSLGTLSTPLHEAAVANSLDTVCCLLEAGADLSAQNFAGEVPFDCSTSIEIRK
jgi:ankyrin repeat protein